MLTALQRKGLSKRAQLKVSVVEIYLEPWADPPKKIGCRKNEDVDVKCDGRICWEIPLQNGTSFKQTRGKNTPYFTNLEVKLV